MISVLLFWCLVCVERKVAVDLVAPKNSANKTKEVVSELDKEANHRDDDEEDGEGEENDSGENDGENEELSEASEAQSDDEETEEPMETEEMGVSSEKPVDVKEGKTVFIRYREESVKCTCYIRFLLTPRVLISILFCCNSGI